MTRFRGADQRTIVAFVAVRVVDEELLLRAVEVYEVERLDFAEAYLVASAERAGVDAIVSFDRALDRIGTVTRSQDRVRTDRFRA